MGLETNFVILVLYLVIVVTFYVLLSDSMGKVVLAGIGLIAATSAIVKLTSPQQNTSGTQSVAVGRGSNGTTRYPRELLPDERPRPAGCYGDEELYHVPTKSSCAGAKKRCNCGCSVNKYMNSDDASAWYSTNSQNRSRQNLITQRKQNRGLDVVFSDIGTYNDNVWWEDFSI